ncbi:MAG: preprotein translocase subunit SecG, partial [Planctomycetia bacterium]
MLVIFLNLLWMLASVILICIILLQRGRGGGLAGALGGMGGVSAFGTKMGDVFTKITVGVFVFWLLLGVALVPLMNRQPETLYQGAEPTPTTAAAPGATPPAATGLD